MTARGAFLPVAAAVAAVLAVGAPPLRGRPTPPAGQGSFTIEQVLSAPFPSELVAAPTGGAVAWVFDSQGVRNIWASAPPAYVSHRVTSYTQDDGQAISDLHILPGGRGIVYVRGGDPNGQGEIANPTLIPSGVEQGVWVQALGPGLRAVGAPRRVGAGGSPVVAPDGERVAFILKDQVWSASTDGRTAAAQLLHTRGKASGLRWSPDGARLAFVSDRGTHAFVGVYDLAARTMIYLSPSVDRDAYPAWSPDNRHLAFVRVPAETRSPVFGAHRSGQPWSIWVADATTGAGRSVWRASDGRGSVFYELATAAQIFWGSGDHLVFPWERDGWEHLYSMPAAGGEPALLTPGQFEVEQAALAPDRGTIVLSSNQDDAERRHLWRVGIAGGSPPERIVDNNADTTGHNIEWSPTPLADGSAIALLYSSAALPAEPAIVSADTGTLHDRRDLARSTVVARVPLSRLVEPQPVTFPAADGLELHGQLFLPPGDDATHPDRHPALVFFHGGSRRQMLLGWHYMQYYHNAYALNQYLASRGYVVLSVNYRSGIGYGMEFREALDYGATGASEYNDVQGAGLYLKSRPDVDPTRIGAWGGSYGGYLTALALARSSDLYSAGVDFHGVHDWNLEFDAMVPGWDTERDLKARKLAYASSPMSSEATWKSPVLLIQGDDDRDVNFNQTVQLTEDLRARGVHVEQLIFPDEDHAFLTHAHWLQAYHATADFLDRMLMEHGVAGRGGVAADSAAR